LPKNYENENPGIITTGVGLPEEEIDTSIRLEKSLNPDPQEINCCQAMYYGILSHGKGKEHWEDAKKYYRKALTGSHHSAKVFTSWIDNNKQIKIPVKGGKARNQNALRETIENAKKSGYKLDEAHQRGLMIASEFSVYLKPPIDHLWHSLRMLHDFTEVGSNYAEVKKSVGRVGPIHNIRDTNGIPVAGQLRERLITEEEGWLDLDILEFVSGDFTVLGAASGPLVPLLTQADLDVAAHLAFLDGPKPVAPSFSLDNAPSKRTDMRLDRKTFKPAWMAATPFGQSMFLADWIMKSFTMKDGLPSLTDPLISGGSVEGWQVPAIMQAVGDSTGSYTLPDGTHAENSRLEIVLRSADVSYARFRRMLFKRVHQYQLNGADLFVESSLYKGGGDARDEEHHYQNDPSTGPGAAAAIIMDNYRYISDLFPVFERVRLMLSAFSLMCQARRDGVELSSSAKRRISIRVSGYQADYKRDYPQFELSPKPFHKGGCYCTGGVSGRTTATVSNTRAAPLAPKANTVNFVTTSSGFTSPVPQNAIRTPTRTGEGISFKGGSGGHGFHQSTTDVYVMTGHGNHDSRTYYMNSGNQKVDPFTGKTVDPDHPMAHIYHEINSK